MMAANGRHQPASRYGAAQRVNIKIETLDVKAPTEFDAVLQPPAPAVPTGY
jgi:hypothetical protein